MSVIRSKAPLQVSEAVSCFGFLPYIGPGVTAAAAEGPPAACSAPAGHLAHALAYMADAAAAVTA